MAAADSLLTFDELANFLLREASFHTPSELHGLIVGHLAGGGVSPDAVLQDIQLFLELEQLSDSHALVPFYQKTQSSLDDEDLSFTLILPDDDQELTLRLDALAHWCDGFLAGFALNKMPQGKLDDLVSETLNDYAAISQIDSEDNDADDDSEKDYLDILEFIRVSALNIFLEYKTQAPSGKGDKSAQLFQSKQLH